MSVHLIEFPEVTNKGPYLTNPAPSVLSYPPVFHLGYVFLGSHGQCGSGQIKLSAPGE